MTIDYTRRRARAQAPMPGPPFREWTFPDGAVWTTFHRTDAGYLVRFPGLADFTIAPDARAVSCRPVPGVSEDTIEHLYLNQVRPLAMSRCGRIVIHASAVEIHGEAVAFVAESGRGKSTLAATFSSGGFRFLTDDGLVLEPAGGGFQVVPSHPSLRLWSDSAALLAGGPNLASSGDDSKVRVYAGQQMAHCGQARPLRRAYFLGDGGARSFTCERMSATEALVAWVSHSFLLDLDQQPDLAHHFNHIAVLANLPVAYRLDYPRRFEDLPRVHAAIVSHAGEEDAAA